MSDTTEPNTAFPPGQQNSFHEWVDKLFYERNFDMEEVKRVQDRGFLSVTGSLLWAIPAQKAENKSACRDEATNVGDSELTTDHRMEVKLPSWMNFHGKTKQVS